MQSRKRERERGSCLCVYMDQAWHFCMLLLLTFHELKFFHTATPTARDAGKYSLVAQKNGTWTLVSTSRFPKAVHSGPTILEKQDWLIIDPWQKTRRQPTEIPAFALLFSLAWPLHLPFPCQFLLFSFLFTGLRFVLTLTSWLRKLALPFLLLFVLIMITWLQLKVLLCAQ